VTFSRAKEIIDPLAIIFFRIMLMTYHRKDSEQFAPRDILAISPERIH
jgi:hypothetical protein